MDVCAQRRRGDTWGRAVQDWLASKQLDRDALVKIKANYDAHLDWVAWQADAAAGGTEGGAADADAAAAAVSAAGDVKMEASEDVADAEGSERMQADSEAEGGARPLETVAPGAAPLDANASASPPDAAAERSGEAGGEPNGAAAPADASVAAAAAGAEAAGADDEAAAADEEVAAAKEEEEAAAAVLRDDSGVWRAKTGALAPLGTEHTVFSYETPERAFLEALRAATAAHRDPRDPATWVQCCLRVFWPDDDAWYSAEVLEWRPGARVHRVLYHDDEDEEELDLCVEEAAGRVQWLSAASADFWPPPPIPKVRLAPAGAAAHRRRRGVGAARRRRQWRAHPHRRRHRRLAPQRLLGRRQHVGLRHRGGGGGGAGLQAPRAL